MPTLSPAAQAIVNAVDHYETNHWLTPREVAAAALRATADQLTPYSVEDMLGAAFCRNKILAIAAELESQ